MVSERISRSHRVVLVRAQDSNWPRPSRRPSKPPRATFDVPAANSHLQRQPRSYLGSFPLSRPLDGRNHGGRNQRLLHRRGRHCRLHPRGSRVDGRMTLLSSNPLWPAAAAAPPSHSLPSPPRPTSSSSVAPVSPNSHSRRRNC